MDPSDAYGKYAQAMKALNQVKQLSSDPVLEQVINDIDFLMEQARIAMMEEPCQPIHTAYLD